MRGNTHRQRERTLGAGGFRARDRAIQCGLMTGDHNLPRTVIVRNLHDFIRAARLRTDFIQRGNIQSQNRRHAAGVQFAGAFHQFTARAHKFDPIGEG